MRAKNLKKNANFVVAKNIVKNSLTSDKKQLYKCKKLLK